MRRRPRHRLAGAALPLAAAGLVAVAGCGAASSAGPAPGRSSGKAAATRSATSTSPSTTPTPTPTGTPSEPNGNPQLLPGNRIVAYYGAANTPALGILGTTSAEGLWPQLDARAQQFLSFGVGVIPAYELITDVIQASPGADGDYTVQVSDQDVEEYEHAADEHHAMLILDIQPGRSSFLPLAQHLAKYLADPNVGLALDPEWRLAPGQVPDQQIGKVSAAEINQVSAWLDAFTTAHHLPQKLLLVHQFVIGEVVDKPALVVRPHLAMVFNMDGFGGRSDKLSKYRYLASDPRFGLGIKLFFTQDVDILSPAETLALSPPPDVVDYQ